MPVPGPWQLQQNTGATCGHCQLLHSWAAFIPQVGIAFSKPRKNHFCRTSSCSRLPFWRCWGGIVLEGKGRSRCWKRSRVCCGQPGWWHVPPLGTGVTQGLPHPRCVPQAPAPSTQTCSADSSSPAQRNTMEMWNHSPGASSDLLVTVPFFPECGSAAMHWPSNSCSPCVTRVLFALNYHMPVHFLDTFITVFAQLQLSRAQLHPSWA